MEAMESISLERQKGKTLGVKLQIDEIPVLNQRLKADGFETLGSFVRAYMKGEFPRTANNAQTTKLLLRLREKGILDVTTGEPRIDFYKNIDIEAFHKFLNEKYVDKHYATSILHYFERYAGIFFTNTALIQSETPHVREYVNLSLRQFAKFYDRTYANPEVVLLVEEIIGRYDLNRNIRRHDKILIADEGFLVAKISELTKVYDKGELGVLVKFALFTGLRGEEIDYVFETKVCPKALACSCNLLHTVEKTTPFGVYTVVVVNRFVGQKRCYFTIVNSELWKAFKGLSVVNYELRKFAHRNLKENNIAFMDLRKLNYNINVRSEMKELGAEVLAGRAKTVSAKHYMINELDELVRQYAKAWGQFKN